MKHPPMRLKLVFIYSFIAISFVPIMYSNIGLIYFPSELNQFEKSEGAMKILYNSIDHIREMGRKIGLATTWKMFSPSWKRVYWIEWYATFDDENFVYVETPNLSPQYRDSRGILKELFWDFKQARLQSSIHHQEQIRISYAQYLCKTLEKELGDMPVRIRAEQKIKDIPKPKVRGNWTPLSEEDQITNVYGVYRCQEK